VGFGERRELRKFEAFDFVRESVTGNDTRGPDPLTSTARRDTAGGIGARQLAV
jgi:hypothetical protein